MPPLLGILADIPFLLEGALGTAGGLATTAGLAGLASTGVGLAGTLGGPGTPAAQTPPGPTPPNPQQLLQQKELVGQQIPNVVGSTSGLASPAYDALIAQLLAGVKGEPGANAAGAAATGQQFNAANSQPTNSVVNGQNPNLSDFLSSFSG
jgi:hypothetical protein